MDLFVQEVKVDSTNYKRFYINNDIIAKPLQP